jgi:sugar phosphate isomerase/epimerase
MWNWDKEKEEPCFAACATAKSFREHIDAVNDSFFVACLDIGHAEMKGSNTSAEEMVRGLGNRLKALHIHDNDKLHDSHQIPFSMNIDFVPIVKALKEIGYDGYFTLEASSYLEDMKNPDVKKCVKDLYNSAKKLADMYENF